MAHGTEPDGERPLRLPEEPIHQLIAPLERFMHVEAAGGIVLLACTTVALVLANSPLAEGFHHLWETPLGVAVGAFEVRHSLEHWINDALMVLFFFVVGLEVKREMVLGELKDPRRAALPVVAALGGMIAPACVYLSFQAGEPAARGWGIPMATDIAFVVGCMALLGPRVPHGLRVMLLSLAIADDIGAILVIALGYSTGVQMDALLLGGLGIGAVLVLQRLGVRSFAAYTAVGVFVWFQIHRSGVHATIAGVILGLMTPSRAYLSESFFGQALQRAAHLMQGGGWERAPNRAARVRAFQRATREMVSPLEYLETTLHPWVGFVIMPIFALANAGVAFDVADFVDPVAVAVGLGLVLGKPLGVVLFSWLAVRAGLARLPDGVGWPAIFGGGLLAGIGFTMALFIAGLALDGEAHAAAKVGILAGSALAAVAGMGVLASVLPRRAA